MLTPERLHVVRSCGFNDFVNLSFEQFVLNLAPHLRMPFSNVHCEKGVFKGLYRFNSYLQSSTIDGSLVAVDSNIEMLLDSFDDFDFCCDDRFYLCSVFLDIVEAVDDVYYTRVNNLYKDDVEKRKYIKFKVA